MTASCPVYLVLISGSVESELVCVVYLCSGGVCIQRKGDGSLSLLVLYIYLLCRLNRQPLPRLPILYIVTCPQQRRSPSSSGSGLSMAVPNKDSAAIANKLHLSLRKILGPGKPKGPCASFHANLIGHEPFASNLQSDSRAPFRDCAGRISPIVHYNPRGIASLTPAEEM